MSKRKEDDGWRGIEPEETSRFMVTNLPVLVVSLGAVGVREVVARFAERWSAELYIDTRLERAKRYRRGKVKGLVMGGGEEADVEWVLSYRIMDERELRRGEV